VHVINGHDLRDRELIGKMDPYVIVKYADESFKSQVVKNGGTNPTWDHFFEFNVKNEETDEPVRFEVFDHKTIGKDRQVGRADIALDLLVKHAGGKEEGHTFDLVHFDNPEEKAGKIQVGIRYEGDGVPREKDIKRKEELEKQKLEDAKRLAEEEKKEVLEQKEKAEEAAKRAEQEKAKEAELEAEKEKLAAEKKALEEKLAQQAEETKHAPPFHGKHVMHRHARLKLGERLVSENGKYTATLQAEDGNFVLADSTGFTMWAAATNDTGSVEIVVQKDNNVVIYDGSQRPQWSSETPGQGEGSAKFILQNDGNLVLKDGVDSILWASNTGTS